jgi:enhancer of polycomb-like protein
LTFAFDKNPSLLAPKPKLEIPVPRIDEVEDYDEHVPPNFHVPTSYVRYRRCTPEEDEAALEYTIDAEDEAWILNNAKFGGNAKKKIVVSHDGDFRTQLPLVMMERMLDSMEKATGFETIITVNRAEMLVVKRMPELLQMFPSKARAGVVTLKHVIQDVYTYWVQKRSKLKRPLLRRFWPVTACDDTNPHLVFRPREKEKYKLRKKRQNDMDAYRKMKQLRNDFEKVRTLLELVKRREQLNRTMIQMQADWFDQRMYDLVDTSGLPRVSKRLTKEDIEHSMEIPTHYEIGAMGTMVAKKKKRRRGGDSRSSSPISGVVDADINDGRSNSNAPPVNVAGKNGGEPAPNFLHPLNTRECYVASWDTSVPHITTWVDGRPLPTFRFRHRPRVGRGGRLIIDRMPHPPHPDITPVTMYTAGFGLERSLESKERLLDLLPDPIDHIGLSRKIEEMCAMAIKEDHDVAIATMAGQPLPQSSDPDEIACEAVLVKVEDWLECDDQRWGEERCSIGPI